tara:strand:- start:26535 stop:28232 length:1698 start_codon:yes stop_codon:yes gene_type:complete
MVLLIALTTPLFGWANSQLWEEGYPTPINGLSNPYNLDDAELEEHVRQGRLHGLNYPVEVTGILLPYEPMRRALSAEGPSKIKKWLQRQMQKYTSWNDFDDMTAWLGLHSYPEEEGEGAYFVPFKDHEAPSTRMGISFLERHDSQGFTISCAACHSANLFGRKVMGMTNRFPRANEFFVIGKKGFRRVLPSMFKFGTGATRREKKMYKESRKNIKYVEARNPVALGLDTSLAHTALSLSQREKDEYASKKGWLLDVPEDEAEVFKRGREERLRHFVADSKPQPWWIVKYKNKWLADGSVVAGNPILTNLLWNEIGRGTDLKELETWIETNEDTVIKELTTAVFNAPAPKMTDFFDESHFDIARAQRGQRLFENRCSRCHGEYEKAWDLPEAWQLSKSEQLLTTEVRYPEQTPIKNVGTDPQRWQGMTSLEQLNDLALSKKYGIKVKAQNGYVPPPLVGIWARWPYLHNNSIPNLCALFTPPSERPETYYSGEALNPQHDFDSQCNGYPLGELTPETWKTAEHLYDSRKPGQGNGGHYGRIFLDNEGNEILSAQEKMDLIHFLQTL